MGKRWWMIFALVLASAACALSAEDSQPVKPPSGEQPAPVSGADYKVIQEIQVPKEYMVMPVMRVKGDGTLVLYVAQLEGEDLEYGVIANTTRLSNRLLETAKQQREKTGDTRIPVDAAAYRFTMVADLAVSPLWQGVAYAAMTSSAGPVVLMNRLTPPDYAPVVCVSGAFPSWLFGIGVGESIAVWAREGSKIKLIGQYPGDRIELEEGATPVGPAVIRGPRVAYVVSAANRCSLFINGKKVCGDYDAIEPAFCPRLKADQPNATEYALAYIARSGEKSVLVVDGKVQETEFVPVHDLTFAFGGDPYAYAASSGGREFVVRNGVRVTKDRDFARVGFLTFDDKKTKLAYIAADVKEGRRKEWVMIDDRKVTPDYDLVTFTQEAFRISGALTFAGLDAGKNSIAVGQLEEPAAPAASGQR